MPIHNANGPARKNGRIVTGAGTTNHTKPVFTDAVSEQHPATGISGLGYNTQFTSSSKPPLGTQFNNATIGHIGALQVEEPGNVTPTSDFQKVQPWEKGSTLKRPGPVKITSPTFLPSKSNDVPSNPNKPTPPLSRPVRHPLTEPAKTTQHSFHGHGTTGGHRSLSSHGPNDTDGARWNQVKRGAAG